MFKFQALNSLFKSLFEKIAAVELVCLPDVSAQEIPYLRCIHGHKIHLVVLGLPKAYRVNTNV